MVSVQLNDYCREVGTTWGLTAILGTLLLLLPCLLCLRNQVLPVMNSVVHLFLIVLFLQCTAVGNAVEDTGEEGGVAYNLRAYALVWAFQNNMCRIQEHTFTVEEAITSPAYFRPQGMMWVRG